MLTNAHAIDAPPAEPERSPDADVGLAFEELAARLDAVVRRAEAERWSGWSEADGEALEAAAREVRAIPAALARGMNEAFTLGREYGHGEEALDELDREIAELSSDLARQAWGGRGAGRA
jgi:hypothetical protein